jgi:hypothetical protein
MPTVAYPPPRPAPDPLGRCKYCGRPIAFRQTPSGALQPWDVDPGTGELTAVHFGTCPARARAKREQRIREGKSPEPPVDRCYLPACGSPDLVYLAPTGEGGNGHLWASRCLACATHRYLPKAFAPPAGVLSVVAPPPGGPPAALPALLSRRRPEWDWQWGWRVGGGWDWWPTLPADPSAHEVGPPSFPPDRALPEGGGW